MNETLKRQDGEWVGVEVSPRGFANEITVYIADASKPADVGQLAALVTRAKNKQPGDSYGAVWLTPQQLSQSIYSEAQASGGRWYALLPNGEIEEQTL